MVFDFNILKPNKIVGRKFGKTQMTLYLYTQTLTMSTHLGSLYFTDMKKKHRKMLDETFLNYITKEIGSVKTVTYS